MVSVRAAQLPQAVGFTGGGRQNQVVIKESSRDYDFGLSYLPYWPQIGYVAGLYIDNRIHPTALSGNLAIAANATVYMPFFGPEIFLDKVGVNVSAYSAGAKLKAGFSVNNNDTVAHRPGYIAYADGVPLTISATGATDIDAYGGGFAGGDWNWLWITNPGTASVTLQTVPASSLPYPCLHYGNGTTPTAATAPASGLWYSATTAPADNPTVTARLVAGPFVALRPG